jgi:hypothetical protein
VPVYVWKAYVGVEVNSACVRVEGIRGCGGLVLFLRRRH